MEGKFYWLKLKRDFFKRHDIQIIEDMPNGKEYILFYLKLLCESVDHDGRLRFSEQIPYNENMLSTITRTNVDIVRAAISVFSDLNMLEILDDGTVFMAEVHKMLGSAADNDNANRQRRFRERQKELALQESYECVTKNNESKSKSKSKSKSTPPISPPQGRNAEVTSCENPFTGELRDAFDSWVLYKQEKRQTYKPQGLQSLITQVKHNAEKYGDENVADLIRDCMASNYMGIAFDRLAKKNNNDTKNRAKRPGEYRGRDFFDD